MTQLTRLAHDVEKGPFWALLLGYTLTYAIPGLLGILEEASTEIGRGQIFRNVNGEGPLLLQGIISIICAILLVLSLATTVFLIMNIDKLFRRLHIGENKLALRLIAGILALSWLTIKIILNFRTSQVNLRFDFAEVFLYLIFGPITESYFDSALLIVILRRILHYNYQIIAISAVVFAMLHFSMNLEALVARIVYGLLFALLFVAYESPYPAVVLHIAINALAYISKSG